MKNLPLFTTQSGVASLILEQIPFNRTAYVRIQSSIDLENLLQECIDFCRAVGAEEIFASGKNISSQYGCCASIIRMSLKRTGLPRETLSLVSLNAENLEEFRSVYNQKMRVIPNASGMTIQNALEILENKSGYFVFQGDEKVGIGIAKGEWVRTIISLKKGMGESIMFALNSVLDGELIRVELIDSNLPAKRLYERMGFCIYEVVSKWYKIFSLSREST